MCGLRRDKVSLVDEDLICEGDLSDGLILFLLHLAIEIKIGVSVCCICDEHDVTSTGSIMCGTMCLASTTVMILSTLAFALSASSTWNVCQKNQCVSGGATMTADPTQVELYLDVVGTAGEVE